MKKITDQFTVWFKPFRVPLLTVKPPSSGSKFLTLEDAKIFGNFIQQNKNSENSSVISWFEIARGNVFKKGVF